MTDRRERVLSIALAALLVVSTLASVGVGMASGAAAANAAATDATFHVTQGDACYEVTPYGDGTKTVREFYGYRAGSGTLYGSYGEGSQAIQENQVSHLFLYRGSEGMSLVMLHDELNESKGGAITFDISGLPADREWVVEDDDYPNRDDNFDHGQTSSTIDWMWASDRTDGAAVRGLSASFDAITIDPAFGEESWAYQERDNQWPYATDDLSWELQSGDGQETPLNKTQSLSVSKGSCPDTTNPVADLSVSPTNATVNETVTFDASDSNDNRNVTEYRWDFDGDGNVDNTTQKATVTHSYETADTYETSVTVVDEGGNEDTATATVTVERPTDGAPNAALSVTPKTIEEGGSATFDAGNSTDDRSIVEYRWDTDGDGTPDQNSSDPHLLVEHADAGQYEVTVTVVDDAGNTDDANATLTVTSNDTGPTANADVSPSTVPVGANATFDGSNSTDDGDVVSYEWEFDDGSTATGATVNHSFETAGEHSATLTVTDDGDNTDETTVNVTVESSTPAPTVSDFALANTSNGTLEVSFDSSQSLDDIGVELTTEDNGSTVLVGKLNETDFEVTESGSTTQYVATATVESNGTYAATLTAAANANGDAAAGQTDSATVEFSDDSPTVMSYQVQNPSDKTVEVSFYGSPSIADIEVNLTDGNGDSVRTLDESDFTTSDGGDYDVYEATTTVESNGTYTATLTKAADADGDDAADGQSASTIVGPVDGSIEYVNASAIEVTGEFELVHFTTEYYTKSGYASSTHNYENVSGTTIITSPTEGVNGSAIISATADKDADDAETELRKDNPYDYEEWIKPDPVSVAFQNVSEGDSETYNATFNYNNPNDETLYILNNEFTAENSSLEGPTQFEPGTHEVTVEWTPESPDDRVTWTVNQSNFGLDDATASTPPASEFDDGGNETNDTNPPTAAIRALPTRTSVDSTFTFEANESTDDTGIVEYRWDFDGDGSVDRTTDDQTVTHSYSTPGTRSVSVTVADAAGNTDDATVQISVYELRTEPSVEFLNATAVEVTGEFEVVQLKTTYFANDGVETSTHRFGDVSGTTVLTPPDEGVWGPVTSSVEAYENASDAEPTLSADNPDSDAQIEEIRPDRVSIFVDDATKVDNGTYEVTFGYVNPNGEAILAGSGWASDSAEPTPPTEFEPGRHTFTATWTPASNDSNLVWMASMEAFGYAPTTATSPTPEQIESGDLPPTAALDANPDTVEPGATVTFDASASDDDGNVTEYRWDFDGDDEFEKTTETPTVERAFSATGTHDVRVVVADESGQTDAETATVMVKEQSTEPPTDGAPSAALSAPEWTPLSEKFRFDAGASTDDEGIVEYRWDFDGDGKTERKTDQSNVWLRPWKFYGEAGTYDATVTVADASGNTDSATVSVTVKKTDTTKPTANVDAPDTVEVGEEFEVTATDLNEGHLAHVCWKFFDSSSDADDHAPGADGETVTWSFDEKGQKTVQLVLRDRAGNRNLVTTNVTVVADSGGDNGEDNGTNGDDDGDKDNNDDPVNFDPNEGTTGGYVPSASPSNSGSNDDPDSEALDTESITAEATDGLGTVAVTASGANDDLEVTANATVPDGVRAPTPADDGIVTLSYLDVSGAETVENLTFTVPSRRLNASNATADDVGLFRFADGRWTSVDTEQVATTDDAYQFRSNVSQSGTFAVGVGEPAFAVTDLSVGQSRVDAGDAATVVATVENVGVEDGTYEATLSVGGEVVATKDVTVPAGESREVTFEPTLDAAGVYPASVGDANADLTVEGIETTAVDSTANTATTVPESGDDSSSSVPGFGAIAALVALAGAALFAARKR